MKLTLRAVDEQTVRSNATTQLEFGVDSWGGNAFCLWFPECVHAGFDDPLWEQWEPSVAHQDFVPTTAGGMEWRFANDRCEIVTRATPNGSRLDLETRVTNRSDAIMPRVAAQNCLHLPKAPDFFCLDYSRVWFRHDGTWRSVLSTGHKVKANLFLRADRPAPPLPAQVTSEWFNVPADHPLIMVEAKQGIGTIGFVARRWQHIFHNGHPQLGCIHSEPQPVSGLPPGKHARFEQRIYLHDGDHAQLVREYGAEAAEFGDR